MTRPLVRIALAGAVATILAGPADANERVGNFGPVTDGALPFTLAFSENADPPGSPPALHSFALAARPDGTWLMLGGRGGPADQVAKDRIPQSGMHGFNPTVAGNANFPKPSYNTAIWVYSPMTGESLSYDLSQLPDAIAKPLQTTSQQSWYDRKTDQMTVVGGYGWNPEGTDLITYDTMIQFKAGDVIDAIRQGLDATAIAGLFQVLHDPMLQVTGGELVKVGSTFYLVFGQDFQGGYFAFGESLPAGTTQAYTEEVRQITMVPGKFEILGISAWAKDHPEEYHRRDLNVRLTRDATNGKPRIGVYGGVFKRGGPGGFDTPILMDPVVRAITLETGGSQLFNGYATALIPIWADSAKTMSQVFFGGIGHGVYHTQDEPVGIDNDGMPFGSDISVMTHHGDGSWAEFVLPEPVPGNQMLAANGVFVINPQLVHAGHVSDDDIILLDTLPDGQDVLIGWVYGGILSDSPQPPKDPSKGKEAPTRASDKVFEVHLSRSPGAAIPVLP